MARKIHFTWHAREKFSTLAAYGFRINKRDVTRTISKPVRIHRKGKQTLAIRRISEKYALSVVYEERKGIIIVITFYPVRREMYGI